MRDNITAPDRELNERTSAVSGFFRDLPDCPICRTRMVPYMLKLAYYDPASGFAMQYTFRCSVCGCEKTRMGTEMYRGA